MFPSISCFLVFIYSCPELDVKAGRQEWHEHAEHQLGDAVIGCKEKIDPDRERYETRYQVEYIDECL